MKPIQQRLRAGGTILAVAGMACWASMASATTYTVDGVGVAPGSYANISLALQAIGQDLSPVDGTPDGVDGTPDVINVTVNSLLNHPGIFINGTGVDVAPWGAINDDITINGDANADSTDVVLALASGAGAGSVTAARFGIELAVDQRVTVNDMVVIPHHTASGDEANPCFVIDEGVTSLNGVAADTGVTLNNIVITAADTGNVPVTNYAAAAPGTARKWAFNSTTRGAGLSIEDTGAAADHNFRHFFNNLTIAHVNQNAVFIGADAGGALDGNGDPVNDARIEFNTALLAFNCTGASGGSRNPIQITDAANTNIALTQTIIRNSAGSYGVNFVTSAVLAGVSRLAINEGCQFYSMTRGVGVTGGNLVKRISFNGTALNPVVIRNNTNRGVYISSGTTQIGNSSYLQVNANSIQGFEFNEVDLQYPDNAPVGNGPEDGPTFTNCIFADNSGGGLANSGNVRIADTNTLPSGIHFVRCTFHDPRPDGTVSGSNLVVDWTGTTKLNISLLDSIISGGTSGVADYGIRIRRGSEITFDLTNCTLATSPAIYALGPGLETVGFPDGDNAGSFNVLNLVNVIQADPVYASTTFGNAQYLHVRNGSASPDGLANASSTAGPLAGAASYIGDGRVFVYDTTESATLHDATINVTSADVFPLQFLAYTPAADPGTLGGTGLPAVRNNQKYWDVSFNPATANPVADVTLTWPDSIPAVTSGRIYRLAGGFWNQAGTFLSQNTAGNPNTTTHSGVNGYGTLAVANYVCPLALDPISTAAVPSAGGSGFSFNVNTDPGCSWTATATAPWITGISPSAGVGPASITFNVSPNAGNVRGAAVQVVTGPTTQFHAVSQVGTNLTLLVDAGFGPNEDFDGDADFLNLQAAFDALEVGGLFNGTATSLNYTINLDSFVATADVHDQGMNFVTYTGVGTAGATTNINGLGGNRAVVALGWNGTTDPGLAFLNIVGETVNVNDVTFMPRNFTGATPGAYLGNAGNAGDAVEVQGTNTGTVFNFNDTIWCANNISGGGKGVPGSTDGNQPYNAATMIRFFDDLMFDGVAAADNHTANYSNCVFTQSGNEGLLLYADANPTVTNGCVFSHNEGTGIQLGTVAATITGTSGNPIRFYNNNTNNESAGNHINGVVATVITLTYVDFQTIHGFARPDVLQSAQASTPAAYLYTFQNVTGSGTSNQVGLELRNAVVNNTTLTGYQKGIDFFRFGNPYQSGAGDLTVDNSEFASCLWGLEFQDSGDSSLSSVTNSVFRNNQHAGIRIFENAATPTDPSSLPTVSNSVFVNNGTASHPNGSGHIVHLSDFAGYPLAISNCTFHDTGAAANAALLLGFSTLTCSQAVTIIDSIISGSGDTGIDATAANNTIGVTYSALVAAGPHSLANAVVDPSTLVTLGTGVINDDPIYTSTTFGNPAFLEVRACTYQAANSTSGPLVGGGSFTAGPCSTGALNGDADGDGFITIADATAIYNYVATLTGVPSGDADVDNNAIVDNADADAIVDFLANGTPLP